ncbi:MAG: Ig-like domain-containing protein [Clostridiales bacterium]|nr:Ig-like domain-containing protein [Clostridiales bacterium]
MKKIRAITSVFFAFLMLVTMCVCAFSSFASDGDELMIKSCAECVDRGDLRKWASYFAPSDLDEYIKFIENESNKNSRAGIFAVANEEVIQIKSVDIQRVAGFTNVESYLSEYKDVAAYFVKIKCKTLCENKFYKSGDNYRLMIIAGDENTRFIVEDSVILSSDFYGEDIVRAQGIDTPIYASTKEPDKIVVYRTSSGVTETVGFRYYQAVVVNAEFGYASVSNDAYHKAGVMAVKMYGWFRTLRPKYPALGYDVKDSTSDQVYDPYAFENNLASRYRTKWYGFVDELRGSYFLNSAGQFFQSGYVANSSYHSYAVKNGGILSQNEARSLGEAGYSYEDILHYFYDYSALSYVSPYGPIIISDASQPEWSSSELVYPSGSYVYGTNIPLGGTILSRSPITSVEITLKNSFGITVGRVSLRPESMSCNISTAVWQLGLSSLSYGSYDLTLTAENEDGGSCTFFDTTFLIAENRITDIVVTPPSLKLNAASTKALEWNTVPKNATYTSVKWESSNEKAVSVDSETGVVKALKLGTSTVSVTVTDAKGNEFVGLCTVETTYTWWQWLLYILLLGWLWM